ncbi:SulP family inorganic anion transporter [Exiguobacterium sp. RIT452]|jgi:SulP family sulfate permease|uniref:SulP family inorganic anion transporter n=1 Tax=Exiguobacterium TaxID=33986 RepID=UPI00047C6010|nr:MULTISPECIES: SulP family inorganic anion transporter [Exiguobacterium]RJP02132.1 SulP family inorganic anion transporter [Exiguobacterium sp. RIT452]
MFSQWRKEWVLQPKADILSGIVVALALVPEAIAFSLIAGVNPMVGLYASVIIAIVISIAGGRPGMISAATGAMALVVVQLVKDHGVDYLLAAGILAGVFQILLGVLGVAKLLRFIPRAVMVGFVNALAILIFSAQLPQFAGQNWIMYAMVAASLAIILIFPRFTKVIPAPLVAITIMTVLTVVLSLDTRVIGDMGQISASLPSFFLPNVPFSLETLQIIFPYALSLAFVGLIESLLTARIVDEMTDTTSNKATESRGQGIANIIAGFFGGMPGCAMIGQSVINVTSGGRGRLSTFTAGAFLMLLMVTMNDLLMTIPMGALVGVMFFVSYATFDWGSFKMLKDSPKSDSAVMLATVLVTVLTDDLSMGVLVGILLAAILFASKISRIDIKRREEGTTVVYAINGPIFFASTTAFVERFDLTADASFKQVTLDFTAAHLFDDSATEAIETVVLKYQAAGIKTELVSLNEESQALVDRLARRIA